MAITSAGNLEKCSGRWEVNTKGGPNSSHFEISVIREDYKHGHSSYGWFDDNKLLVSHNGGPCMDAVTRRIWNGLVDLAEQTAIDMNELDEIVKSLTIQSEG